MLKTEKLQMLIEKIFLIFLFVQVPIDLLTTFFVNGLHFPISFGMFARFLFMGISFLYVLINSKKRSKILLFLAIIMFLYQMIYVILILHGSLFMNAKYFLKAFYYLCVLFFSYTYLKQENKEQIFQILNINVFIIGIVFFISILTNTAFPMYEVDRYGYSAWFLSGNEISSIMVLLSWIPIYQYTKKQSIFHFMIVLLNIFVLTMLGTKTSAILLIMVISYNVIIMCYLYFKTKKGLATTSITVLVGILFLIFSEQLPVTKNIKYQIDLQQMINEKQQYKDNTPIPASLASNRYKEFSAINTEDYVASIQFQIVLDQEKNPMLNVSGYFYPMYFDVSHPAYIEKTFIFRSKQEEIKLSLVDTYNRYIIGLLENQNYSADFGGLKGTILLDQFTQDTPYETILRIKIDNITKEYKLDDTITLVQPEESEFLQYQNHNFTVKKWDLNGIQNSFDQTKCNIKSSYNFLLSGRNQRLVEFITCNPEYSLYRKVFGTGYIKNYIDIEGFEMDIPEIAITFGIFGFFIYFALTFYLIYQIIKNFFKQKHYINLFHPSVFCLGISVLLGFGSAFLVGHMILTPSSAIYLALLLVLLHLKMEEKKND